MHTCLYCQREYQRKVYFDRHVIACQFLSKTKKDNELERLINGQRLKNKNLILLIG